jgi:rhodanese-related sulfurtransferase
MRTTGVFEVATGRRVSEAIDPGRIILDAELSPDNRQLAILTSSARTASERDAAVAPGAKGNEVVFWDWPNARHDLEPIPLPAEPRDLAYSPDGKTVAVICGGGQVLLIEAATGRVAHELQSHATTARASNMYKKLAEHRLRFSPDGQYLIAWGTAAEIRVWETATGRPRAAPLNTEVPEGHDLQISADGRLLATTRGVWEFDSGRLLATLPEHPDGIFGIAFSPDATQLLTACRDGMARLWDWRAGARTGAAVDNVSWIEPGSLAERLGRDPKPVIVDVRGADEFNGPLGHIANALNLPVGELPNRLIEINTLKDKPVILVCRTDKRSANAAALLADAGFRDARVLQGGMERWNQTGLPVERPTALGQT